MYNECNSLTSRQKPTLFYFLNPKIIKKNIFLGWVFFFQFFLWRFLRYNIIGLVVQCSAMDWETGVQCQVESYQRLKKWYLIPPCLTLRIKRHVSRVKWSNPGKGVAPSPKPRCSSYWNGSFRVVLDYGRQLYLEHNLVFSCFIYFILLMN